MTKLLRGDCLQLMKELPAQSIDLILCDPPYQMTDLKWDTILPFDKLWEQYKRIIKPNAPILLFCNQPFTTEVINSNKKDYRYNWYWIKNNATGFAFARYQPMRCLEDICVFYEKMPAYHPPGLQTPNSKSYKRGETGKDWVYKKDNFMTYIHKVTGYPRNVMFFDNEVASQTGRLHNTQKPVKLLEYFIKTYTDYGQTVLDNCMGSGSTGVACVNTGRDFIGMELEDEIFTCASARIKEAETQALSNLFDIRELNNSGGGRALQETYSNEGGIDGT